MSTTRRLAGSLLGALVLPLSALAGQAPVLGLTLGGGEATDLRGNRAGAVSLAPSLTLFPSPSALITLAGRATRFGTGVWSAGGSAGLLARAPLSSALAAVVRGSGDATYASWRATYLQAELQPALELSLGDVALSGGVKGAAARTSSASGTLPGLLPSGGRGTASARSALGPAWGASARLGGPAGSEIRIRYREERLAIDSGRLVDRVGTAELRRGPLTLTGSLGWRRAPAEARTISAIQISVEVARGITLLAAAESYPSNPLTETVAGRALSLGVSLRSGGIRPLPSPPRPGGVPAPTPGLTRLALRDARARTVEVAGDWNKWTPIRLARAGNGVWYVDVRIDPGEYRYAFRVNGSAWTVPDDVAAVDDGFGGRSAWLSVRAAGPAAEEPANFKEER
jgi:hypothetical protein